jgi:hypothetical protein
MKEANTSVGQIMQKQASEMTLLKAVSRLAPIAMSSSSLLLVSS